MLTTTNYGLKKPEGTDVVDIQNFNDNADIIDQALKKHDSSLSDMVYQTAGGSATAITLTIKGSLVNGYPITFIASINNGGAATTINGKKLYKPGTTTSPNLIAGKAYTVWYNSTGDCFFIKASAEGTALAKDVRKNTTFSNDNDTGITGGLDLSLLVPGNIRAGVTIDGVTGKSSVVDTADATVVVNHMLVGETAYKNGSKVTGTAVNQGAKTITPGIANQTIAANTLLTGLLTVIGDPDLIDSNIVSGKNIFGIDGTAQQLKTASGTYWFDVNALGTRVTTFSLPAQSFTVIAWVVYEPGRDSNYSWWGSAHLNLATKFYSASTSKAILVPFTTSNIDVYSNTGNLTWLAIGC